MSWRNSREARVVVLHDVRQQPPEGAVRRFAGLHVQPDQGRERILVAAVLRLQHGDDVVEKAAQQLPLGRLQVTR